MSDLLNKLSEDDLVELLREIRRKRTGKKVDWENMSDEERRAINRTVLPATFKEKHEDYPRALYAMRNGTPITTTVDDAEHEAEVRTLMPDVDWGYKIPVETCPSSGAGRAVIMEMNVPDAQARLAAQLEASPMKAEQFGPLAAAAAKRGWSKGKPRKTA